MITGIIGKPNVGKSTFFNAATLMSVPVANFPFTTISPNFGTAYIRVKCVHTELGVEDNPVNSACVDGTRLISVRLVDVAGLVPGAALGRGLGNKFLDDLRQADAFVHVVDASGSSDEEGRPVGAGMNDPIRDIELVQQEVVLWAKAIIEKDWPRISRTAESKSKSGGESLESMLFTKLSGLSISLGEIDHAIREAGLKSEKPTAWSSQDLERFGRSLVLSSKPSLIAANKCDQPAAKDIVKRLKEALNQPVVPCAAEAELLLRRAAEKGLIRYIPGDSDFVEVDGALLSDGQRRALQLVKRNVLDEWQGTGVQNAVNGAYLDLLKGIVVYPVEDETRFADKKGNVLPDAKIMHRGDTVRDLAYAIHTDLGNSFLYAVDARSGLRLGSDHELKNNDVIKIVAATRKV